MTDTPVQSARRRGTLFIISGPSGAGKDSVLQEALPRLEHIRTSISVTTRAPRKDDEHGVHYFFITPDEFAAMQARGELLEFAPVHRHMYGTPRAWVMEQLDAGIDVVLEIDVQGAMQVKRLYPDVVLVFLATPSLRELADRLRTRDTETDAEMDERLAAARQEMAHIDEYDYLIINDVLEEAAERFRIVVTAERMRPHRQDLSALFEEGTSDA